MMDAYMMGNIEEAKRISQQINDEFKAKVDASFPERKSTPDDSVIKVNTSLNSDDTSAVEIDGFLSKHLGEDWWDWEIETIIQKLWVEFGIALSDSVNDKVLAIRHLCRSDLPFRDWYEFNQIALSFGGAIADFTHLRKPSPGMVINAVKSMNKIRPDAENDFGDDVIKYIAICLIDDGVYAPPPSIEALISSRMRELVSKESSDMWPSVKEEFKKALASGTADETSQGIQAKRLIKAEASALQLFS